MKNLICVLFVVALCGCSDDQKQTDARLAAIELRLRVMEGRVSDWEAWLDKLKRAQDGELRATTNRLEALTTIVRDWHGSVQELGAAVDRLERRLDQVTNRLPVRVAAATLPSASPRGVSSQAIAPASLASQAGVPQSIYDKIASTAAANWPNSYDMQRFEIKHEAEAYRQLHGPR